MIKMTRKIKLELAEIAVSVSAIVGMISFMLGATSCFIGITGIGTIKLVELLAPRRDALKTMILYGGTAVGSGLFFVGAGVGIAKYVREPLELEELLEEIDSMTSNESNYKLHIPNACVGCVNFHGHSYNGVQLVCAIYPSGWEKSEQCPDWEHKPND